MHEIMLQSWTNSNMAGDQWRWEVCAVFNAGYWSVRDRQVDEITDKVIRVAGAYRLKSARGIKAGIVQCVDTYFKAHGRFPVGDHQVDVTLEDERHLVSSTDGFARHIRAPGEISLPVSFPDEFAI